MANDNLQLRLDTSQFQRLINSARDTLSPKGFDSMMWAVMRRTGDTIRTQAIKAEQAHYDGKKGWIRQAHDKPVITRAGGRDSYGTGAGLSALSLKIRVHSERGKVGEIRAEFKGNAGPVYPDRGSGVMRGGPHRGYTFAHILHGKASKLPMDTGRVDTRTFRMPSGKYVMAVPKGGIYYPHRVVHPYTKEPFDAVFGRGHEHYKQAVALSVAQMPTNAAADDIQDAVQSTVEKRLIAEYRARVLGLSRNANR